MRLRTFLLDHPDGRYLLKHPQRGERVVGAQEIANHYSAYLDAEIVEDGSAVAFLGARRNWPAFVVLWRDRRTA